MPIHTFRGDGPAPHPFPRRIVVKGSPGAGKTTVARALAARLGVPHVELDALHHGANWSPASPEELRRRVEGALDEAVVRLRTSEEVERWLDALESAR